MSANTSAISTMISWSYYGEQGMVFMLGQKSVVPYKFMFCLLVFVSTLGFIRTPEDLESETIRKREEFRDETGDTLDLAEGDQEEENGSDTGQTPSSGIDPVDPHHFLIH